MFMSMFMLMLMLMVMGLVINDKRMGHEENCEDNLVISVDMSRIN